MNWGESILKFDEVSFEFGHKKPILDEVGFSIRRGAKLTLMGQNGAGKSTIFKLITGEYKPEDGDIITSKGLTIATARQVIPREELEYTVEEFFQAQFKENVYDITPRIDDVLEVVNLHAAHDKKIKDFSGGQQARLLLASALIQKPDILLLDEPTNNLDKAGIEHLTQYLVDYKKTLIVISHDADFLNAFTEAVLYLDVHTRKVEQYMGNYKDVVKDITARVAKEQRLNAQMLKTIQAKKDKSNAFAHKGGGMRLVAKRMREAAADAEESMVDVRREDKTIRKFTIPAQEDIGGVILQLNSVTTMDLSTPEAIKKHKLKQKKVKVELKKNRHLLLSGPNGIGKTTLLESIANGTLEGETIAPGTRVGYYRQDFSTLNFDHTAFESLEEVMLEKKEQDLRSCAAGFLLTADVLYTKIGALSEGQKGLVAFARLVLQKPGLLILDEPTNHINFRHIPVIAKALHDYKGAMVLVSHVPEFVKQVRIDEEVKLG